MKTAIVIQARTGSNRLPRKVLAELAGRTVLEYTIRRCQLAKKASSIIVATSNLTSDDAVAELAAAHGVLVFRGSENDVLLRYVEACQRYKIKVLVRITADCPLIDPKIINQVIEKYECAPSDYIFVRYYPDGLGAAELLTFSALQRAMAETTPAQTYYREHVMTYITEHPEKFSLTFLDAPVALRKPAVHLSVDNVTDLEIARRIAKHFLPRMDFDIQEIMEFLDESPELAALSRRRTEAVSR